MKEINENLEYPRRCLKCDKILSTKHYGRKGNNKNMCDSCNQSERMKKVRKLYSKRNKINKSQGIRH